MKAVFSFALIVTMLASCSKDDSSNNNNIPGGDDSISQENKDKAVALQSYLEGNKFQLSKYYSDTPIDYIDTDNVVKAEQDLWPYVSEWLKDDHYQFGNDGQVTIEQNANKVPGDDTDVLHRPYSVVADQEGVAFKFMGHEYQPLDYRLIEFSDTLLRVSATWNGKTVKSDYKVVQ
jgi:hypothetical protein